MEREELGNGISIYINNEHRFGTDAFLLSDFVQVRQNELVCDLGTGSGIVALLWFRKGGPKKAYAVEIQPDAVELLERSVEENGLKERLVPINADLKELALKDFEKGLDAITCNPPYKRENCGIVSAGDAEATARHEIACNFDDVCACAKRILRYGGRLCVCNRPERLADMIDSMRKHGIEPKTLRCVQQRADRSPWLVLLEGRRGGNPFLKILPPLIVEDSSGGFSDEMLRIYGKTEEL